MNEVTNGDRAKKERLRSASNSKLPVVSVIPDQETMKQAVALLKEATKLKVKVSEAEDRLEEIKLELFAIASSYDLSGFRYGLAGFENRGYSSRSTLNKQKMISDLSARGIGADVIAGWYESGNEFLDARITTFDVE